MLFFRPMKLFPPLLLLLCLATISQAQYVKVLGVAAQSGKITTSGVTSTTSASKTFPGATITILNSDNTNATIYSDAAGTSKSNPYQASLTDATYDFFIRPGAVFSVRVSGTSGGITITSFTRSLFTAPGTNGVSLALCGGTADTSLLSALSALGGTIQIPKGITCASNSLTISTALQIDNGGLLKPITGQTLTLTGTQLFGGWQRYTNATAGLGTISFSGNTKLVGVDSRWWGTGLSAITAALTAVATAGSVRIFDTGPAYFRSDGVLFFENGQAIPPFGGSPRTGVGFPQIAADTGLSLSISSGAPIQLTTSEAGLDFRTGASDAVAGTSVNGAAIGGSYYIFGGDAKQRNSGNAVGGSIVAAPGLGIGTGERGSFMVSGGHLVVNTTDTNTDRAEDVRLDGARTTTGYGALNSNTTTSSTAGINKYGLFLDTAGTWNGAGSHNYGLWQDTAVAINYFAGNVGIGTGATVPSVALQVGGTISATTYTTTTNCTDSAGAAACGSAAAGSVVIDAAATSVVVSTTAVTANSQIFVQNDSSLGTRLGVTCNTQSSLTLGTPRVTARTAGTSFTITIEVGPTTNPMCLSYAIIN